MQHRVRVKLLFRIVSRLLHDDVTLLKFLSTFRQTFN